MTRLRGTENLTNNFVTCLDPEESYDLSTNARTGMVKV